MSPESSERQQAGSAADSGAGPVPPRFPDFYLVGHPKCGTTALFVMLRQHPEIFMSARKEPRYFALDRRSVLVPADEDHGRHQRLTEEGYLDLYRDAAPGQKTGDASPNYLVSREAAGAIAAVRPDAKIIAIFREPADFLRSLHEQLYASHVEDQLDFRRAIELEAARARGEHIPRGCHHPEQLIYADHVRYAEQLARYRDAFPAENIHVIVYDDLRKDNEGTVRDVLRFLEVQDDYPLQMQRTDPVRAPRSARLHRFAGELRRARRRPEAVSRPARIASRVLPESLTDSGRGLWRRFGYAGAPPRDADLEVELRARFSGEVDALGQMLGRDLTALWGRGE
ncbi:MAG TPA: sulfotransferase [Solirubrobacteraceae bacterium]|nr:sulfotransferase [Solirubrobacteraceae bacterium]